MNSAKYHATLSKEQVQAILKDCKGARATAILWGDKEAIGFYSYHVVKSPSGDLEERRLLDLQSLSYAIQLGGKSLTFDDTDTNTFVAILKSYRDGVIVELWPDSYDGKCNITIGDCNAYRIATLTFRGKGYQPSSYCSLEKVITSWDYDRLI